MTLNSLNRYHFSREAISRAIKGKNPPPFMATGVFSHSKGKLYATVNGRRLKVISVEDRDKLLRDMLYTPGSGFPFGRDSIFNLVKTKFLGISKRDINNFLKKQEIFVKRRSRPPKEKRVVVNRKRTPGVLSTDLAHIREADFIQLFKERGKAYMWGEGHHDRYFLNSVELHTGYLVSDILYGKARQTRIFSPLAHKRMLLSAHGLRRTCYSF